MGSVNDIDLENTPDKLAGTLRTLASNAAIWPARCNSIRSRCRELARRQLHLRP